MKRLLEFFAEDNGNLSAQRFVFVMANLCIWSVWTYSSMKSGQLQPISPELLVGLGIAQIGKVAQKFGEK
jgi:hypothetical protein